MAEKTASYDMKKLRHCHPMYS